MATQVGSSAFKHGAVFRLLVLEDARLRSGINFERAMAVEMVRGDVQHHRHFRPESFESFPVESWKFRARSRSPAWRARPGRWRESRCCRRPAPGNREAVIISPVSVVVVVFPFEPVMATIGPGRNWAASSISPITVSPSDLACTSGGASTGTPGLTTIRSCSLKGTVAMSPGFDGDAVVQQHGNFIAQLVAALGVGDRDARTVLLHETERRPPRIFRDRPPERVCRSDSIQNHHEDTLAMISRNWT